MATVVNLYPDTRWDSIGAGLGKGLGDALEERRNRKEMEARQKALEELLTSPRPEDGGPSDAQVFTQALGMLKPDEALSVVKQRREQFDQQDLNNSFSKFLSAKESGMTNDDAFALAGNPNLAQPLSQLGVSLRPSEIKLYDRAGAEFSGEVPAGTPMNDEALSKYYPEKYSLGFNLTKPAPKTGEGGAGKPTDADKNVEAFLRSHNIESTEDTQARARDFIQQRDALYRDIDATFGRIDKATGAVYIQPGRSQDVVQEAKSILADLYINSPSGTDARRAESMAIEKAVAKVNDLAHITPAPKDVKGLVQSLKNRNWDEGEVEDAINARIDKSTLSAEEKDAKKKEVKQAIDKVF